MERNSKADSKPTIHVSIDINASAEDIFNAWIDSDKLSHWMFGPEVRKEKIIKLQTNAHKGGKFSFIVEREGQLINHIGTYLEVRPHTRLVFTWGIESESDDESESIVTIDITLLSKGCRVELTHVMDPKWQEYKDRTEKGWAFMLGKLKGLWS